jgi:hypothetical protein
MTYYEQTIAHYVSMARIPGAIDQARHSVMWLAKEWPELFGELPKDVAKKLKEDKSDRTNPPMAIESTQPQRSRALVSTKQGGEAIPGSVLHADKASRMDKARE